MGTKLRRANDRTVTKLLYYMIIILKIGHSPANVGATVTLHVPIYKCLDKINQS